MLKRTYLKLVEMQEEQARRHLDEVRSIHSEMRGYKHDFHHHLQALKGQLEAGEVERAIAYITELDRSLQSVDTLLKTGNVTVDAIHPPYHADQRQNALFLPSERRRKPKNEDRLPVPDGKIRRARLRPAPRGGHFGAAWRLGQIQQ